MKTMVHLGSLNLSNNDLRELPEWIDTLRALKRLDLSNNYNMTHLHSNITSLPLENFTSINCAELVEPPLAVCLDGFSNIKQYYKDLERGRTAITLSTIVLIGNKEAGKSTLLKAMQNDFKREILPGVEKTKVFEIKEIDLSSPDLEQRVRVIDFGGDTSYQHAYQLTFRKDCIPMVVVSMQEYKREAEEKGSREATRRVAFDWLSHLLMVAPGSKSPILILTHSDKFVNKEGEFKSLKADLINTIRILQRELFKEYRKSRRMGFFKSRSRKASEIFENSVFDIGYHQNTSDEIFTPLKEALMKRARKSKATLPDSWKEEIDSILSKTDMSYLDYSHLSSKLSEVALDKLLSFMQRSGLLLRYTDEQHEISRSIWERNDKDEASSSSSSSNNSTDDESDDDEEDDGRDDKSAPINLPMSNFLFHNIPAVAKLISTLYDHTMMKHIVIQEARNMIYESWKSDSFSRNGIIQKQTLEDITEACGFQFSVGTALLSRYKLLYGPVNLNFTANNYLLPHFMPKHTVFPPDAEIKLYGAMIFRGLKVPEYAFQQMTVVFLEALRNRTYQAFPYGNGASVKLNLNDSSQELDAHLIHDVRGHQMAIRVEGSMTCVHDIWKTFIDLLRKLRLEVKKTWPATKFDLKLSCPHCLVLQRSNPAFLNPGHIVGKRNPGFREQPAKQETCAKDKGIPLSLLQPCESKFKYIPNSFSATNAFDAFEFGDWMVIHYRCSLSYLTTVFADEMIKVLN